MSKVDTILEEIKGLTLLEASDLVKKMEEAFGVSAAAATVVAAGGGGAARGGAAQERGEPRQRNSLTQFEAGTYYKILGLFGAPRSRVCSDPGQVVSHSGDLSFLCFSDFAHEGCRLRRSRR